MSTRRYVLPVLIFLAWSGIAAAQTVVQPDEQALEHARTVLENQVEVDPTVRASIEQVLQHVNTEAWSAEQAELKRHVGAITGVPIEVQESDNLEDLTEDRLVVFVSSSVPLATLRNYAAALEKTGGVMVLRGAIGSLKRMGPTMSFVASVLKIDPSCTGGSCAMRSTNLVIDPELFRENGISRVPAAIFVKGLSLEPYCERFNEGDLPKNAVHVVYGDVSPRHMAEELFRLSKDPAIGALVKSL